MDIAQFRTEFRAWIDANLDELAPRFAFPGTLDEHMAQMQRVKRLCFDAGWMRYGWPERVGGLGGAPVLRTELGASLMERGIVDPGVFSLIEVLAPTLVDFAPEALAAEVVPLLLSGDEMWCQGFSEPGSGSDLASLSCRAVPQGGDPETATHWVVNGQKVWTSLAQYSDRCVLLTRTGTPESRHKGITAFFVDLDTPGITISPIEMINGDLEFCEVFYDDVVIPSDRILGGVGGGWAVAMHLLPFERSSCFWQRIAYLYVRMNWLAERVPEGDDRAAEALGNAWIALHSLRARSRKTQQRLGAGETIGAETSVDKLVVAQGEYAVYDAVRRLLPGVVELDDGPTGEAWRAEFLYSRASSVYGGSAEVQRNIVARRLLELGEEGS